MNRRMYFVFTEVPARDYTGGTKIVLTEATFLSVTAYAALYQASTICGLEGTYLVSRVVSDAHTVSSAKRDSWLVIADLSELCDPDITDECYHDLLSSILPVIFHGIEFHRNIPQTTERQEPNGPQA